MLEFHRNERARQLRPSLSRSWLLVRPNSAEKDFEEAFASEADSIILDLEDGCPEDEKDEARSRVVKMLNSGVVAWVRINAITTEHWWKDVKALKNTKGLRGVMLATAEHATDIDRTASELRRRNCQRYRNLPHRLRGRRLPPRYRFQRHPHGARLCALATRDRFNSGRYSRPYRRAICR